MTTKSTISGIIDYDLSFVKKKFELENVDQDVDTEQLILELKRWMAVCILHPRKRYTMVGVVDDIWHTFVLFTYEYRKFCYTYGDFIEHFPSLPDEDESPEETLEGYKNFLEDYEKLFCKPNPKFWPSLDDKAHPVCIGGGGCSGGKNCRVTCNKCRGYTR